jgi:hypothetical protein
MALLNNIHRISRKSIYFWYLKELKNNKGYKRHIGDTAFRSKPEVPLSGIPFVSKAIFNVISFIYSNKIV